jgi:hypothetical protein
LPRLGGIQKHVSFVHKREAILFRPVGDLSNNVSGLRASGTVVEQDVREAVAQAAAAAKDTSTHRGLVVFVDPEFDGYLAELIRGLEREAAQNPASFARWALVVKDDVVEEASQFGSFIADSNLRVFPDSARTSALEWVAG